MTTATVPGPGDRITATETPEQARAAMTPVAVPATTAPTAAPESIADRFRRDTADHGMTVVHDEGLYRHLRFRRMATQRDGSRKPTSMYWVDLITWPGCLAINADMGSFLFFREEDMFGFFRGNHINPGYWAEKVKAGDPGGVTAYSPEKFRQSVTEDAAEAEKDWPGLTEAVKRDIFGGDSMWDTDHEAGAVGALRDFEFGASSSTECACGERAERLSEDDAVNWAQGRAGHRVTIRRVEGFTFTDAWEWNLSDYTCQFLWCCHAIPWGIAQYDAAKRDTGEPTPAGSAAS